MADPRRAEAVRVGYLGPRGTFSEEALRAALRADAIAPVALETVYDVVMAVRDRSVEWALAPIENSIEGPVTVTLDTLASEAAQVSIAGELVRVVHHHLSARETVALEALTTVLSHPQALGQCAQFLRRELPGARIGATTSTAEAVRLVSEHGGSDWAAIGTCLAARTYGCRVLRERIEDQPENETRFIWLGRAEADTTMLPLRAPPDEAGEGKTSLVFWGPGAERPGWLVACLDEFARREINLTKIESRPRRERLGHYMFFADLQGRLQEARVAEALSALREHCQEVWVLGSYPVAHG
jgi:prephenate dehydratase